jgi:chromosome segregation ATPase
MIKEKHTLIEKNKTIIENLNKEVEKARSSKKEMENEISKLYDSLSSKFKESQELEKELEIAKENRKKATVEMMKNNIN